MKYRVLLREIPWLLFSGLLVFSASVALGMNIFMKDSALDINVYNTYFAIYGGEGLFFLTSLFVFMTFGFRCYTSRMTNVTAFLIFSVSGIFLVLALGKLIALSRLLELPFTNLDFDRKGWTIYPPLSTFEREASPIWSYAHLTLQLLQVVLTGFMIYTGYKVGLKKRCHND